MKPKIWLSSPHIGGQELAYIQTVFDTNWVAPVGPQLQQFEEAIARYTGVGHVAALASGTAAIHLALILLGVGAGDEVLCPTLTFAATVNPIVYQQALPILVDSEAETWNMSPKWLEAAIQDRLQKGKKPKAVLLVHLYGMPAKLQELLAICERYQIPVIEDAAEALGSSYEGQMLGSFGAMGVLSFNGNKIITTSGGGALLSNQAEWIDKARFLATQARDPAPHYQHSEIGYNYRLSNVLAAIGLGQMEVLPSRVSQRRANFEFYQNHLQHLNDTFSFQAEPQGSYSNRWLTCVLVKPNNPHKATSESLRLALADDNIEARPVWKPMHMQPIFAHCPYYGNGVSEQLFAQGLCLPSGSNLAQADLERIVAVLDETLGT